jgi:tetratricopeptide (TPR) repeat protein
MAKDDWFRRTTWTDQDRDEFQARLARSRGAANKAQYLRIQAYHLAEAREYEVALELLEQLLKEYPEAFELEAVYDLQARCFIGLDNIDKAIEAYHSCFEFQKLYPHERTHAKLDYCWLIAINKISHLYAEVEPLLKKYQSSISLSFPIQLFKLAATRALIAEEEGRLEYAAMFIKHAMNAAQQNNSGLRYHPNLGLVGEIPREVAQRLAAIERRVLGKK